MNKVLELNSKINESVTLENSLSERLNNFEETNNEGSKNQEQRIKHLYDLTDSFESCIFELSKTR
jgi:hypothetical protein